MNKTIFDNFKVAVMAEELGVYGIHAYKHGEQSAEYRFRDDVRVHLYSGSKAFTSMAVGIAEGEGRLKLSDKALDFFPEFKTSAASGSGEITLRDLLQMRGDTKAHCSMPTLRQMTVTATGRSCSSPDRWRGKRGKAFFTTMAAPISFRG